MAPLTRVLAVPVLSLGIAFAAFADEIEMGPAFLPESKTSAPQPVSDIDMWTTSPLAESLHRQAALLGRSVLTQHFASTLRSTVIGTPRGWLPDCLTARQTSGSRQTALGEWEMGQPARLAPDDEICLRSSLHGHPVVIRATYSGHVETYWYYGQWSNGEEFGTYRDWSATPPERAHILEPDRELVTALIDSAGGCGAETAKAPPASLVRQVCDTATGLLGQINHEIEAVKRSLKEER